MQETDKLFLVLEYARLPSEAPEIITDHRPPASWPTEGAISFNDFSARYRPELDLILKNINLSIKSKEKIGIVGRTGGNSCIRNFLHSAWADTLDS